MPVFFSKDIFHGYVHELIKFHDEIIYGSKEIENDRMVYNIKNQRFQVQTTTFQWNEKFFKSLPQEP